MSPTDNADAGWVYVLSDPTREGLLKIGFTTRTPEHRAREMSGTHSPLPLQVQYSLWTEFGIQAERQIHSRLAKKRVRKEWFRCTLSDAKQAVDFVCGPQAVERARREEERVRREEEERRRQNELAAIEYEKQLKADELVRAEDLRKMEEFAALPAYARLFHHVRTALSWENLIAALGLVVVAGLCLLFLAPQLQMIAMMIGLLWLMTTDFAKTVYDFAKTVYLLCVLLGFAFALVVSAYLLIIHLIG